MKCENCIACSSYFDGIEEVAYCKIGITEDEAYHDGEWYCNLNRQTIKKRLQDKNLMEVRAMDKYVCKENLTIPFEDDDGSITDKFGVAKKDSIWKVSDEIGESDVRLYLVSGESDFSWMDITNETLKVSFIRI